METKYVILLLGIFGVSSAWRVATNWPSRERVENELTRHLDGTVIRPWDQSYYDKSAMMNTDFNSRPGAIAFVQNAEDIRKCILFARKYHLRVTVRSSGHSYVGRSTGEDSLQINVSPMNNITVIPSESAAVVGSGNTWRRIYEEVDKYGLLAVGGSAHTVSIGGYMLGGGHSPMTRMLGLGVDSILEITLVTAQGDIVTATNTSTKIERVNGRVEENNNGNLFWAVRGGGLAFGVVTQYKIQLHQPPPKFEGNAFVRLMMFASIDHPFLGNVAKDLLDFYGGFVKNLSNNWGGYILINGQPACVDELCLVRSNGTITIAMLHFGGYDEAVRSIRPLLNWGTGRTLAFFNNFTSFWHYEKTVSDATGFSARLYNRLIRDEDFSPSFSQLLTTKIRGLPLQCTAAHIGGKAKEISAFTSSVSSDLRNAKWSLSCGAVWEKPSEKAATMDTVRPWKEELYNYGKGVYYNEPDYHTENWQEEFWGGNYRSLQSVKQIWDPENFFSCHHCVQVDNPTDPCRGPRNRPTGTNP